MQKTYHSKENAAIRDYVSPDCEVLFVITQELICTSDTEPVDEEDGEW